MEIIDYIKKYPLREFRKGDILLSEGQQSARLFALVHGYIKVTSIHDDGSEKLLWIEGRYDIAPTEKLFSLSGELSFFYTALSDGSYYDIDKSEFIAKAKADPAFMAEVANSMSDHYDDLLKRVDSIGQTSIREKLVATLRYIAERFSASDQVDLFELGLKLTHSDIAAMIGSTRETTSLELHALKDAGLIDYDRTKFIVNLSKMT